MLNIKSIAMAIITISIASSAFAQKPVVYPAKGQSSKQQSKDDGECYTWAKQNTGIDPAVIAQTPPPQTTTTTTTAPGGQRVKGALRGAAGGAVRGEIVNDDAGKGAAIGAVVGTRAGGRLARQQQQLKQQQQSQAQQQQQQQQQQKMNTFYVSYGACMEGRGYTVK